MEKKVRKAVRVLVLEEDKVVAIQYKSPNSKAGYYDIPGGKIEEGETPIQAAIREVKEETTLEIQKLEEKGKMVISYPDRIFDFDVYITNEYQGEPKETNENKTSLIRIEQLLKEPKLLSNICILSPFFRQALLQTNKKFFMNIEVDENETIQSITYRLEEK